MAIGDRLRGAWSKARRYLGLLDQAADYDPREEQQRWIAGIEARIACVEAAHSSGHGSPATKAPET